MDIELKNQSVIEIGKAVGDNVNSMIPQSRALVPAGATAPTIAEAQPMNPFDSMMLVLGDIRDGIYSLVDKFSESVSIQKDKEQDAAAAQDLAQVSETGGDASLDSGGDKNKTFFSKAKDKVKDLMGAGGIKGMLVKGGLLIGLLGLAKFLQKFGRQIAETIVAIKDGIVNGYNNVKDFFTITIPEKFGEFVDMVKNFFTKTVPETYENVKTFITDLFTKIKDKVSEFFGMIKDFFVITVPEKFAEVKTIVTTWFTSIKDNISDLFTRIKDFFVITVPEKVQLIKDSITTWFTNIVDEVKGVFTKVKDFFTITVPTKIQEIKDSITTWFTNIKDEVVGLFTKVKDFVMVEIPLKISEISKGVTDKFTEIKDQIIDFAMAPFKKIKELMQNLLVGILESVEGLPFIGDKAKALKEKILGTGASGGTETLDTAGTGDASIAEAAAMPEPKIITNDMGDVVNPDTGKKVKFGRFDEEGAAQYAAELSKMGQGKFEPYFETKGVNHYAIRKTGESVTGTGNTTTGGATGGEINTESAAAAAAQGSAMGGSMMIGGNSTNVSNSSVQHTSLDESTGLADNTLNDNLNTD